MCDIGRVWDRGVAIARCGMATRPPPTAWKTPGLFQSRSWCVSGGRKNHLYRRASGGIFL